MKFHPFSHTRLILYGFKNELHSMSHMKQFYDTFMLLFSYCGARSRFTFIIWKRVILLPKFHSKSYSLVKTQRCVKDDRISIFRPIPLKVNHLCKITRYLAHQMSIISFFHKYCSKFSCPCRG